MTYRKLTLGVPPRPSAMAHTSVDFPDPLGPITTFRRGPNTVSTSLYTKKFTMRSLTIAPMENTEGAGLGAGAPPEPVSCPTLLGARALTWVTTMGPIQLLVQRCWRINSRAQYAQNSDTRYTPSALCTLHLERSKAQPLEIGTGARVVAISKKGAQAEGKHNVLADQQPHGSFVSTVNREANGCTRHPMLLVAATIALSLAWCFELRIQTRKINLLHRKSWTYTTNNQSTNQSVTVLFE